MTKDTSTTYNFRTISLKEVEALMIPSQELQRHENNMTPTPLVSKEARIRLTLTGFVIGLITKAVTFGSFAFLLRRWGENPQHKIHTDSFFYIMILVLSQIEYVVYIAISIGLTFSLINLGVMSYSEKKDDLEEAYSPMNRLQKKRLAFVLSVNFLAGGVVFGSIPVWLVVGILWGLPMAVLPNLALSIVCLVVFYLLLRSVENEEYMYNEHWTETMS
jgi:hypothetical protein